MTFYLGTHRPHWLALTDVKHLDPVTTLENARRGVGNGQKSHCSNGHLFSPENTKIYGGRRFCVECGRIRSRQYAEKRKEKRRMASAGAHGS